MDSSEETVNLFDDNDKPKAKAVEEVVPEVEDELPSFDVPTKFQGKSFEDVINAYTNLEKENGRKANEVGELRKLTDEILKQQITPPRENINDEAVGIDDFFDNPVKVVDKVLDSNPRLKSIEDALAQNTQRETHKELLMRHKDAEEVVQSPEFGDWVQASPTRTKMLQESHRNFDVEMASDLLDIYKSTRKVTTEEAIQERDAIAAAALKTASVEKGSVESTTKPTYRRAELIRLKLEDPTRYTAMSDKIRAAYAEGRVK